MPCNQAYLYRKLNAKVGVVYLQKMKTTIRKINKSEIDEDEVVYMAEIDEEEDGGDEEDENIE